MTDRFDVPRSAPRLVVALNTSPVRTTDMQRGDHAGLADDQRVHECLRNLWSALLAGTSEAWLGPDGSRGLPLSPADLHERWARITTEMLLGAPYSGIGVGYAHGTDVTYYDELAKEGGAFPLVVACQQSCTIALLTRGVDRKAIGNGANAGNTEGLPIFKGRWFKGRGLAAKTILDGDPPAGSGTLFEFSPPVSNTGRAHIAFVLRTHRSTAEDPKGWAGLQLFDNFAMHTPFGIRMKDVTATASSTAFMDEPWIQNVVGPGTGFTGMGVLPAGDIQGGVSRALRAWPLGFVRLVLVKRADGSTLYATPLLRMHHASDPLANFSVARLAWALRQTQHHDVIEPRWETWMPRGASCGAVLGEGRTDAPARALLRTSVPLTQPLNDAGVLVAHLDITVDRAGKVHFVDRFASKLDRLPWGVRSGTTLIPLADDLDWFRGGESVPRPRRDLPA